jgi:predicted DCC family thiol-disulfide oxidoreductase YuxK
VIVLYDEDCGFCRWTMAWALRRDRDRALTVAPIQSPTGARLLADLTPAERLSSVHVVHDDGRRESGGAAVRDVLSALPSRHPVARVAGIPTAYRFAARHRSRLSRLVPARAKRRADAVVAERYDSS